MDTKPRGRPREPAIDEAVLAATRSVLVAEGWEAVSIERIAREAGVGKASIYRRWSSKSDLVLSATLVPIRELGEDVDLTEAMRVLIDDTADDFESEAFRAALPGLVADCLNDPERVNRWRIEPEIELVGEALSRGRGVAPRRSEAEMLFDLYVGAILMRTLRGAPLSRAFRRTLHEVVVATSTH